MASRELMIMEKIAADKRLELFLERRLAAKRLAAEVIVIVLDDDV
jgi:hypothetical protein